MTALCLARDQHTKWMTQTWSAHAAPVQAALALAAAAWCLAAHTPQALQLRQGACMAIIQVTATCYDEGKPARSSMAGRGHALLLLVRRQCADLPAI